MSLVKPMINSIVAFDATVGTTITFVANGGDQVAGNTIKILLNDEQDTVVYENTVTTYALTHAIPANVLTNGEYYRVAVQTIDSIGNTSVWSNYEPFYCYSTPVLRFDGLRNNQTVTVENFNAILEYNQLEGEKIDYALIELFDANDILVDSSGYMYNSNSPTVTQPLLFSYMLIGLYNHVQYKIRGSVVTVNGTVVTTGNIIFHTNYDTIITPDTLTATLDNCNGYVNLLSNKIVDLVGDPNPNPPIYIRRQMIDMFNAVSDINNQYAYYVDFGGKGDLVDIPKDFLFRVWFYPARQPFDTIRFRSENYTENLVISFKRGLTEDYLSIRTLSGTVIDHSLGVTCNGNTKVFLWLRVVEDTWDVQTEILESESTILDWDNGNDNAPYNASCDITWGGESREDFTPSTSVYYPLSKELNCFRIGNGIYDNLHLSTNVSTPYTTDFPDYDDDTLFNINFNGTLDNIGAPVYTKLVLKRKDSSLLTWINLSETIIKPNTANYLDFNDSFIPTGVTQTYAMLTYIDGVESEYYTVEVTPTWSKYFLSDKNNRFTLNYAVIYSNHVQNVQNGVFVPINAKYPIVVQNAEGNYRSGSLQFKVLGYQYEIDKRLDRVSITKQTNDILAFLTNGKAKCLTDFNGNIFICKVINSPQISYDANWGNGITTISFDWVEQTKYNDYEGMLELGLFDQTGA